MSINLGNKQPVMFLGDKFVKNVYLGNKILQPWTTIKSFDKVAEYSDTYNWSYQNSSSSLMSKDGYIKFKQPILTSVIRIDNAGYSGISSPSGTLKVSVKNVNKQEIMSSELRFAYSSSSEFGTTYKVTNVVKVNNSMYSGEFNVTFGDGLINWQPFSFTLGSNVVTVKMWNLDGESINFDVTLDEAYSGWSYEILNTSSQNFDINFAHIETTGNFPENEQYMIVYNQGTADNTTGLPSAVTLNRNEEYTVPNNVMEKADVLNSTYTITFKYNYTGSPADIIDYQYNKSVYTTDGWTKTEGSSSKNYSNGQVVCNLLSNTYDTSPLPSLTLYPCFKQTAYTEKVTTPIPTRSGYRFLYWGVNSSGTGIQIPGGQEWTFTANTTLYAQWEAE